MKTKAQKSLETVRRQVTTISESRQLLLKGGNSGSPGEFPWQLGG